MTHVGAQVRTADIALHLIGPRYWTELVATLSYAADDPFAVRVRFGGQPAGVVDTEPAHVDSGSTPSAGAGAEVEWLLGRDLLHAGLRHPVGSGDVRLWPTRTATNTLFLELRAPFGHALLELSRSDVESFLLTTEELVPRGAESDVLDLDGGLFDLLGGRRQRHERGPDVGR